MHWTLALTALLVLWAMAGCVWRKGSIALVGAWIIGQVVFIATGNNLPIGLYWATDLVVLYALMHYHASTFDTAIMVLFVPCWYAYVALSGVEQWWTLWAISCLQLFLAGPFLGIQRILSTVSHGPRRAEV